MEERDKPTTDKRYKISFDHDILSRVMPTNSDLYLVMGILFGLFGSFLIFSGVVSVLSGVYAVEIIKIAIGSAFVSVYTKHPFGL